MLVVWKLQSSGHPDAIAQGACWATCIRKGSKPTIGSTTDGSRRPFEKLGIENAHEIRSVPQLKTEVEVHTGLEDTVSSSQVEMFAILLVGEVFHPSNQ